MNTYILIPYIDKKIRNYKELCKILDENVCNGGTQRKAQIDRWKRFFRWDREKNAYIIREIFDEPLPNNDKRKIGNNAKYLKLIEPILINYLYLQNDKCKAQTKNNWFVTLGMVNKFYDKTDYAGSLLKNYTNSYNYNKFMQFSESKLKDIFLVAINNLKRREIIDWEEQIVIVPFDNKGFIATKYEKDIIDEIEKTVLLEFECETKWDIKIKGLTKKYYRRCNEIVQKNYKWSYYFRQFFIKLINLNLTKAEIDYEQKKIKLNNIVIDGIINTVIADVDKYINIYLNWENKYNEDNLWDTYLNHYIETGEDEMTIEEEPFKYYDDFVDTQIGLAEKLIRIEEGCLKPPNDEGYMAFLNSLD